MRLYEALARAGFFVVAVVGILIVAHLPGWLAAAGLGLLLLSAVNPWNGLIVVAGLMPLGPSIGGLAHAPGPLTEALTASLAAGVSARGLWRLPRGRGDLVWPALILATVVAASYAIDLPVRRTIMGPEPFTADLMSLVRGHYFFANHDLGPLAAAAWMLEGGALFVIAAHAAGGREDRLGQLARVLVVAAAGAALLNLARLMAIAIGTGEAAHSLPQILRTTRINVQYGDVNAAGS